MSVDEAIIDAVRVEPIIYNKTKKGYKNKDLKAKAWKRISLKVGLDEFKCQRRWKGLRDQFVRDRNIRNAPLGSALVQKKEWKYYKKLSFLENHVTGRKTSSNLEIPEDSSQELWNTSTPTTRKIPSIMEIISDINSDAVAPEIVNMESSNNSSYSASYFASTPFTSSTQNKRRKSTDESEDILALNRFYKELLDSVKSQNNNEVDLYFQNLAKIVAAEKLSNLDFLDLQAKLTSFLRLQLEKYKK